MHNNNFQGNLSKFHLCVKSFSNKICFPAVSNCQIRVSFILITAVRMNSGLFRTHKHARRRSRRDRAPGRDAPSLFYGSAGERLSVPVAAPTRPEPNLFTPPHGLHANKWLYDSSESRRYHFMVKTLLRLMLTTCIDT